MAASCRAPARRCARRWSTTPPAQVLAGSFMDYAMPRAAMVPRFTVALTEDPTKGNPLRVKGGGEAGITPALAVIMNAVVDALSRSWHRAPRHAGDAGAGVGGDAGSCT